MLQYNTTHSILVLQRPTEYGAPIVGNTYTLGVPTSSGAVVKCWSVFTYKKSEWDEFPRLALSTIQNNAFITLTISPKPTKLQMSNKGKAVASAASDIPYELPWFVFNLIFRVLELLKLW